MSFGLGSPTADDPSFVVVAVERVASSRWSDSRMFSRSRPISAVESFCTRSEVASRALSSATSRSREAQRSPFTDGLLQIPNAARRCLLLATRRFELPTEAGECVTLGIGVVPAFVQAGAERFEVALSAGEFGLLSVKLPTELGHLDTELLGLLRGWRRGRCDAEREVTQAGRLPVPAERLYGVFRDAVSLLIELAEIDGSTGVAPLGPSSIPNSGGGVVGRDTKALFEDLADICLSGRVAALGER